MWRSREVAFNQAVKAATAEATTATVLAAHIEQCKQDKADIKQALAAQDAERRAMHAANEVAFARINRVIWIAWGVGVTILFFSSALGQILLKKFFLLP